MKNTTLINVMLIVTLITINSFCQTDVNVTGINVDQDVIDITRGITKIFSGLDAHLGFGYCF